MVVLLVGDKVLFGECEFDVSSIFAIRYGYLEANTDISQQSLKQSLIAQMVTGFSELKHSRQLRLMIALTIAGQFFFQAHYQLWQALFLKQGFDKEQFYIYYVIFQLISLGAYSLPVKMDTATIKRWYLASLLGLLGASVFLAFTVKMSFLLSYLVLVFIFTFFEYFSNVLFSKTVSPTHISSLTSLRSSCGRLASLVSLLLSSLLLTYLSVKSVVLLNFGLAIIASLVVIF